MDLQEIWKQWDNAHMEQKQINSKKSASKTKFIEINKIDGTAIFIGNKGEKHDTSLSRCSCFAFGKGHQPCKHMYRLASELGITEHIKEVADIESIMQIVKQLPEETKSKLATLCYRYRKDSERKPPIKIYRELAQPLLGAGICKITAEPKTKGSKTIDIELADNVAELSGKIKRRLDMKQY